MNSDKEQLLAAFAPISLEEMNGIRLMNRLDTKYVMPLELLNPFLRLAVRDYRVQEVDGERDIAYHTVYLDTPARNMYFAHLHGQAVREKIRVRTYVSSNLTFLEVKNKDNKGRTDKKRIRMTSPGTLAQEGGDGFLQQYAGYTFIYSHCPGEVTAKGNYVTDYWSPRHRLSVSLTAATIRSISSTAIRTMRTRTRRTGISWGQAIN